MVHHLPLVSAAIVNSLASSTWVSFKATWKLCCEFLQSLSLKSLTFSDNLVIYFLYLLMQHCYSYTHLVKILAGVCFFAKIYGFPIQTYFLVNQALKCYRRRSCLHLDARVHHIFYTDCYCHLQQFVFSLMKHSFLKWPSVCVFSEHFDFLNFYLNLPVRWVAF